MNWAKDRHNPWNTCPTMWDGFCDMNGLNPEAETTRARLKRKLVGKQFRAEFKIFYHGFMYGGQN